MSYLHTAYRSLRLRLPGLGWFLSSAVFLLSGSKLAGQEALVLKGHVCPQIREDIVGSQLRSIVYSPDGRLLASGGGRDNRVILWNAATGEKVWSFDQDSPIHSLAFSPDGRSLALALNDDGWNVVVYEVATWKERLRVKNERFVEAIVFSPDGQYLAWRQFAVDVYVMPLWSTGKASVPKLLNVQVENDFRLDILFSPDSKHLIVGHMLRDMSFWDLSSGKEVATKWVGNRIRQLALCADGRTLAVLNVPYIRSDGVVQLWDIQTKKRRLGLHPPTGSEHTFYLAAAAKESVLVTASSRWLTIFKGPDAEPWATRCVHEDATINAVSVSPDGKRIATANSDGTVSIYDVPREKEAIKERLKD